MRIMLKSVTGQKKKEKTEAELPGSDTQTGSPIGGGKERHRGLPGGVSEKGGKMWGKRAREKKGRG